MTQKDVNELLESSTRDCKHDSIATSICEMCELEKELEQLRCENAHLFNLLKSVYYAIDGSSEGLPIPAEVWDQIEDTLNRKDGI